ncbi:AraC family transcriptional regulator [Streptomyces sp. KM77-8]|uniref:AraC family transcriptional regulator n=1 Tax=Streptomyces haneummycinicus TaxID=3074435 RepID=A0AAT9HML3_9ACTN
MISALNRLVDLVEEHIAEEFDVRGVAAEVGTTGYHLRRMFSSLAGMPLSEYVRRRRMTLAAADVVQGEDDLLTIAVRHGYGSTEAFGRAFRAVHGAGPGEVRREEAPAHTTAAQVPPDRRRERPHGHPPHRPPRVPADRTRGPGPARPPRRQPAHPGAHHRTATGGAPRLKALGDTEPGGLLQVSDDVDPDGREGTELTYLHGVAVSRGAPVPDDLDAIEVPAGKWAVFSTAGPHPQALQTAWAATATEWFPPTRGVCAPAPRSSRSSSARTTSAPPPASSGCPSNPCDRYGGPPPRSAFSLGAAGRSLGCRGVTVGIVTEAMRRDPRST